jgi:ribA/ribD-fused uncharacterized protein
MIPVNAYVSWKLKILSCDRKWPLCLLTQQKQHDKIQYLEAQDAKLRLQFVNLPETKNEKLADRVRLILTSIGVETDERTLTEVYRMGKYTTDKTRTVMLKFHHFLDRDATWKKRAALPHPQHLRQLFPEEVQAKRKLLQPIVNLTMSRDQYKGKSYLRNDNIVVNGVSYSTSNLHKLPDDLKGAVGCTVMDDHVYYYGSQSPMSNHYLSDIELEGLVFNCAEQAYFYTKAMHYEKFKMAAQIRAEMMPIKQKRLGESFGEKNWGDEEIAATSFKSILLAKFQQSSYLQAVLKSTGEKTLVEANPYDYLWGTGCMAEVAISSGYTWPGKIKTWSSSDGGAWWDLC